MDTRIGYGHADSLLAYPQANNLSMNAQPIRERGVRPNQIAHGARARRLTAPLGTQPTPLPTGVIDRDHRQRSRTQPTPLPPHQAPR